MKLRPPFFIGSLRYARRTAGVLALAVAVQSPRMPPAELDARVEAWLARFRAEVEALPAPEFAARAAALADAIVARDESLADEFGRHWGRIASREYTFAQRERTAAAVRRATQPELLAFLDEHVVAGAPARRRLSVRVFNGQAKGAARAAPGGDGSRDGASGRAAVLLRGVDELRQFKRTSAWHPALSATVAEEARAALADEEDA